MSSRYSDENIRQNKQAYTIVLLLCDGMLTTRRPFLDHSQVRKLLQVSLPQMSTSLQQLFKQWESGATVNLSTEISPEADEIEALPHKCPTQAERKGERILETTGQKHQPTKRIKKIHPGTDDCGEDASFLDQMIGYTEAFTIYDQCNTPDERMELHIELDKRTELFLLAVETSFTPHHHFFGTSPPINSDHGTHTAF